MKSRYGNGFTLVELLVAVALMAVFSALIYANFNDARAVSRDTERQASLRVVETALELHRQKYGRYPEACNGPSGNSIVWSGQSDSSYACPSGSREYIVGLAPEFIPILPTDARLPSNNAGYVYAVNSDGSVYKFMALNTVEVEVLSNVDPHPFFRCGSNFNADVLSGEDVSSIAAYNNSPSENDAELCERTPTGVGGTGMTISSSCTNPDFYEDTYAVSAGFSTVDQRSERRIEYYTEVIRCG